MADPTPRQLDILAGSPLFHAAALEVAADTASRDPNFTPRQRFQRAELYRQQAAVLLLPVLARALADVLNKYCRVAESGDAGYWDPEEEPCVQAARAALAAVPPGARVGT